MKKINIYAENFFKGLEPDPNYTVSEWADAFRYLSQAASSEPGKFRTSRTPYLKEIMDELSPQSKTTEVIFMKGSQVGGTEAGNNWVGAVICLFPGPMLVVQPTVETAKRWSKMRLSNAIADTPMLREKVKDSRSRDSGNTIQQKDFPGGTLIITGANSAVGLRSMPVRYLFLDEIDAYDQDVGGEGDPVILAERRTATYKNKRKILKVSTPVIAGLSRIEHDYEERSSKGKYCIPCPHCKNIQELVFENLTYKVVSTIVTDVKYVCVHCGVYFEEHHKTWFLAPENGAKWVHEYPDRGVKGFHLSALYSPAGWYSWQEACQMYEEAKEDDDLMKVFVNTVQGLPWHEKGEAPEWEVLYARREDYDVGVVPYGVALLTAGVDVQKDRIEIEVVGWGKNKESWSIEYKVIHGNTSDQTVWVELSKYFESTFKHECGSEMKILQLAIDSGYATQEVYYWSRHYPQSRVIAVKGNDRDSLILNSPTKVDLHFNGKKIKNGVQLWHGGVSVAKQELYRWLNYDRPEYDLFPAGYCHFPKYDVEYFKQLTAEQLVVKKIKGYTRSEWIKVRDRNEALDCRVLARIAAYKIGVDRFKDKKWDEFMVAQQIKPRSEVVCVDNVTLKKETLDTVIPPKVNLALRRSRLGKSRFLGG